MVVMVVVVILIQVAAQDTIMAALSANTAQGMSKGNDTPTTL